MTRAPAPDDGHPLCCSWHATDHFECSCWHEEVRTISRLRPDPGPDPNVRVMVQLPCDGDIDDGPEAA